MIYELARDVGDLIAARKFPVPVVYAPERTEREGYSSVILAERDRDGGDQIRAVQGSAKNPRLRAVRELGARFTVFAASPLPGAHVGDHERECEQIVDALIIALQEWFVQGRTGALPDFYEARYLRAGERSDVEAWPGVAYTLACRVPRGVRVLDYVSAGVGEGLPTGAAGGTVNEVHVRRNADDPPEIVELP